MEADQNRFDDNAATQPLTRDAGYQHPGYGDPYGQQFGGGYGYGRGFGRGGGMGMGMGMRRQHGAVETKPFFLTSEFLGTLMAIVAIAISAATMPNFNARLAWILITSLVAIYTLSRGVAKCGTRSRAYDPREELFRGHAHERDGVSEQHQHRVGV